jgi:hypothetical protein
MFINSISEKGSEIRTVGGTTVPWIPFIMLASAEEGSGERPTNERNQHARIRSQEQRSSAQPVHKQCGS